MNTTAEYFGMNIMDMVFTIMTLSGGIFVTLIIVLTLLLGRRKIS